MQVYTGPKRKATAKEKSPSAAANNTLEVIQETTPLARNQPASPGTGFMVGFRDPDGEIRFGKVTALAESSMTLLIHRGTVGGEWSPIQTPSGKHYTLEIKREDIIDDFIFMLTRSNRLPGQIKNKLRLVLETS